MRQILLILCLLSMAGCEGLVGVDEHDGCTGGWLTNKGQKVRVGTRACGINQEGFYLQSCKEGSWMESTDCSGTHRCKNGTTQSTNTPCGLNQEGTTIQTCTKGTWEDSSCTGKDVCKNGATQPGTLLAVVKEGSRTDGAQGEMVENSRSKIPQVYVQECQQGAWVDGAKLVDIVLPNAVQGDVEYLKSAAYHGDFGIPSYSIDFGGSSTPTCTMKVSYSMADGYRYDDGQMYDPDHYGRSWAIHLGLLNTTATSIENFPSVNGKTLDLLSLTLGHDPDAVHAIEPLNEMSHRYLPDLGDDDYLDEILLSSKLEPKKITRSINTLIKACGGSSTCIKQFNVDFACNGLDDDCDGKVDEDFTRMEPGCGLGACRESATGGECIDGLLVPCTPGKPASDDNCNGIDNDCNGVRDDGFTGRDLCGKGFFKGWLEPFASCEAVAEAQKNMAADKTREAKLCAGVASPDFTSSSPVKTLRVAGAFSPVFGSPNQSGLKSLVPGGTELTVVSVPNGYVTQEGGSGLWYYAKEPAGFIKADSLQSSDLNSATPAVPGRLLSLPSTMPACKDDPDKEYCSSSLTLGSGAAKDLYENGAGDACWGHDWTGTYSIHGKRIIIQLDKGGEVTGCRDPMVQGPHFYKKLSWSSAEEAGAVYDLKKCFTIEGLPATVRSEICIHSD